MKIHMLFTLLGVCSISFFNFVHTAKYSLASIKSKHKAEIPIDFNAKVSDVVKQINHLSFKGERIAALAAIGDPGSKVNDHILKIEPPLTNQTETWALIPSQFTDNKERCHCQGVQRTNKDSYIVFTYNSRDADKESDKVIGIGIGNDCEEHEDTTDWGGAHIAIVKLGSKTGYNSNQAFGTNLQNLHTNQDKIVANVSFEYEKWHPSGIQMIGDYLVVAVYAGHKKEQESKVIFFDLSAPETPRKAGEMNAFGIRAKTVGITSNKNKIGKAGSYEWILALSDNESRTIQFYKASHFSHLQDVLRAGENTGFRHSWTWNKDKDGLYGEIRQFKTNSFNSLNLVAEKETNRYYLIGTGGYANGKIKMKKLLNKRPGRGENWIEVFRIEANNKLTKLIQRKLDCNKYCDFDAAGGVYVSQAGKLAIYGANYYAEKRETFTAPKQEMVNGSPMSIDANWVIMKFSEFWSKPTE